MKKDFVSRRNFIRKTALTAGIGAVAPSGLIRSGTLPGSFNEYSAREIWIAGVSQADMTADTPRQMGRKILDLLKDILVYQPDFVCLPEAFPFLYSKQDLTPGQRVEISDGILDEFSGFSAQNNCYTICPVYTRADGGIYNSAVAFDRKGNRIGIYNKIHPTEEEIEYGILPGALSQSVIQTDFGPAGIQICFDINWQDGWKMLRAQGAKIIFWPSAYAGGITVNTKAWQTKCIVASATNKNTSKLCDITGETITQTGIWNRNLYCGPVNPEKAFLATWPYVNRFSEIQNKYGRKVRITTYHEEEWSVIESLSLDVLVKDILREFDLKTYEEHISSAEAVQEKNRK
ncbi:MAG: carbon-nitrogen hydrolase family protein [Bacteroidota bacterium]|nr:carbon-nitrogen hydrolase family protein [Bacteroidota bacterium]